MTKTYLKYRSRITILSGLIIFAWVGLSARLFQIMVLNSDLYRQQGFQQGQRQEVLPYVRGNIYDRKNVPLTRNIIHYTLSAHPDKVEDKTALATAISTWTKRDPEYYLKKLNRSGRFVHLERNLSRKYIGGLLEDPPPGLIIKRKSSRSYPHGSIASQILGFTDVDDLGITGIEKQYNRYLQGKPGWVVKQLNGRGSTSLKNNYPMKLPIDGSNIQLTIDLDYQSILQEEMERRVAETGAKGALGILMNPQTGAILAMASIPDYNPNRPGDYPVENQRNRVITDQFEPGSSFKIVTATAALANHVVTFQDEFNCEGGAITIAGKTITDHEEFDLLTFPQIIAQSSNVGTIKVARLLGKQSLYRMARDYGFGTTCGMDLPGEARGTLRHPDDWSEISLAEVAIGYEVGVTALQLATAYSAIANGGFLMKPHSIKQVRASSGEILLTEKPEVIRKVADKAVMDKVKEILVQVVQNGTGTKAAIKGWSVAGKTGTAHKFIDGSYADKKFISDFAGFFPAENPQIVGVFVLDEPRVGLHWGGQGAAPLFRRVMERIINLDDSIYLQPPTKKEVPKNLIFASNQATTGSDQGLTRLATVASVSSPTYTDGYTFVPEVRGMSIRKAKQVLLKAGLRVQFSGSGRVVWQSPPPGTKSMPGSLCTIGLK